ncbi:hypothetical protein [Dyella terrae]|uniref:hypothetical protein n=1 Tax=Dyella terrae TaxID=522259 RepID=UPI001EFC30E3|nr:hypothetical protein [Dyella terrae]
MEVADRHFTGQYALRPIPEITFIREAETLVAFPGKEDRYGDEAEHSRQPDIPL